MSLPLKSVYRSLKLPKLLDLKRMKRLEDLLLLKHLYNLPS
jgi:hypothetical protein